MLTPAAATRLHRQLTELPELIAYAHLALMPGSGPRGGRVSGATRTAPLPCRADVLSLLGPTAPGAVHDPYGDQTGPTPIPGTIASWVQIHLEESEHPLDDATLGGQLRYLSSRPVLAWAVLQRWADDYAHEIDQAHRVLQPLAMLRARRRRLQLPCPREACGLLALTQVDGDDIECGACGLRLRQGEYDHHAERYLLELNAA